MNTPNVDSAPQWRCTPCGPDKSLLSERIRRKKVANIQQRITLSGKGDQDLVKALRFLPEFKGRSMEELLGVVHKAKISRNAMLLRLSNKLIPNYRAILRSEGIKVEVL